MEEVFTLLLVDVDGVLNVCLRDGLNKSLLLSATNLRRAKRLVESTKQGAAVEMAQTIVDVAMHTTDSSGEIYADLAADSAIGVSDVMVARLAQLIRAAGQGCRVILSSSWRLPEHAQRKETLEAIISKHLGEKFHFHGATDEVPKNGVEGKIIEIGDAIEEFSSRHCHVQKRVRVLILDDLSITSLGNRALEQSQLDQHIGIENYFRSRAPPGVHVEVGLVHTYDSWTSPRGFTVEVGAGLTTRHFGQAMTFLWGKAGAPGFQRCAGHDAMASTVNSSGAAAGFPQEEPDRQILHEYVMATPIWVFSL